MQPNGNSIFIADDVHDIIEVPEEIKCIIDTQEFQRLRELKQLGTTYYVFPGASHNRFEHSLGVYYLARQLMLHFRSHQAELSVSDEEIFCVSVAGLLHDIGHGPFSHVFDNDFVPFITNQPFRHESMSVKLIHHLFKANNIKIDDASLQLICALVSPSTHPHIVQQYKVMKKYYLFQIIANEDNGIDVDKFDYFLRDSHNLSLNIAFKHTRLLTHCRVIDDRICFHEKTSYDVQLLYSTRYDLFKRVYSHKTSHAVALMICDILRWSNKRFQITAKLEKAEDYLELTDGILHRIQYAKIGNNEPSDVELEKAKKLIVRLHKRDLYKCIGYVLLDASVVAQHFLRILEHDASDDVDQKCAVSPKTPRAQRRTKIDYKLIQKKWAADFYDCLRRETDDFKEFGFKLERDEVMCQVMSLSYGMEQTHPIENVYFYNSKTPNIASPAALHQITQIYDQQRFKEVIFRMYVKDKRYVEQCQRTFKIFCDAKKLVSHDQNNESISLGLSPKTMRGICK
mmetsp:Transcript_11967/g.18056  ORF Transcript_11967/g.18056 Transcript_11967/m.18056 type:complete len:513 (-) Transcript_11967:50-1588(-)